MSDHETRTDAERRRWRRIRWVVLPLVLLVSAALVGLTISVVVLAQRNAAKDTALQAQREQAQRAGQTPVAKPPGEIDKDPDQPLATPTPAPSGPRGPGPSDEQVYRAVAAYFAHHDAVAPATIAAYVSNYLRAHPPRRGPGPTPDQIADAVLSYLTAHPPSPGPAGSPGADGQDGAPGERGPQGERGPGPTAEQVADAVRDWLTEHPLPVCPDGTQAQAHRVMVDDDGNPLTTDAVDAVICVKQ